MIKRIIKSYFVFGAGIIVGSAIAATLSWVIMSLAYGNPDLEEILSITECLEEKRNEKGRI
jgi:hypothetical protein